MISENIVQVVLMYLGWFLHEKPIFSASKRWLYKLVKLVPDPICYYIIRD
jgi:hypothetical protein